MIVVERAQPAQIRAMALEGDPHPLGRALQGDFLFESFDLIVGYSCHRVASKILPRIDLMRFAHRVIFVYNIPVKAYYEHAHTLGGTTWSPSY